MSAPYLMIFMSILQQASPDVANQFNGYLILGYGVMWLIATIYVISLASRQRNLQQDIELMQRLLQEETQRDEVH